MTSRHTQTDVPYSADQMYALVADVEKYPEFLPWCVGLRIIERSETKVTADMIVAYKVFRERFRSRVMLDPESRRIDVAYVDGPFRNLENRWRFTDKPEGGPNAGSVIDFEIEFEFRNFLLQATAQAVFDKAFARMSDAFVKRAHEVYG